VDRATQEVVLAVLVPALGIYFCLLWLQGLRGYRLSRRLRDTALATWPPPRPRHARRLLLLGVAAGVATLLNVAMRRPLHHAAAQAVMAAYFVWLAPRLARIPLGFYRDGVWADAGFLPWSDIRRLAFRETPDLVLVLLSRRGARSFRLPVPPGEYGQARKILDDMVRARALQLEPAIPGL
jgi:hypothetical protein